MHFYSAKRERIELDLLDTSLSEDAGARAFAVSATPTASQKITEAARAHFEMVPHRAGRLMAAGEEKPPPAVFRERSTGLLRMVYREVVIRFKSKVRADKRRKILAKHGLKERAKNRFYRRQIIAYAESRPGGPAMLEIANDIAGMDEVTFAAPNFVSEYRREAVPTVPSIPVEQWHLENTAAAVGQVLGEDVDALEAWQVTQGDPAIVVAVLDDGVDVDHPNLQPNVRTSPDPDEPRDTVGRDFFVPDDTPDHFDPRPKLFRFPFNQLSGNDVHGTPCAGVIAAPGVNGGPLGIAPKCRILAVKIFHADALAQDARVADAIRYAASFADIISCSWSSGVSPDVDMAIEDAGRLGRGGKGCAIFCASGNFFPRPVAFPARHAETVAVGATTDTALRAGYSQAGPELTVSAPSSGGIQGIFTTDLSEPNRGFNLGNAATGGADGLSTNSFGGTSSATPLAAGVAALVLSKNPGLDRDAVRQKLIDSADKIGSGYDANGHSPEFGFGRVNAAAAVS